MYEKQNDATRNRPEGPRIIDAPSVVIDLPAYIQQIKNEDAWSKSDRNSITVFKTDDLRIVLGALHTDAEMIPHKAEGMMSIQVLDGLLDVTTDGTDATLRKGQMIAIHRGQNYRIIALEETVYLLTMSDVRSNGKMG